MPTGKDTYTKKWYFVFKKHDSLLIEHSLKLAYVQ